MSKELTNEINTKEEFKQYLNLLKTSLADKSASPVQVLTAFNQILNNHKIYDYLTKDNKATAQELWMSLQGYGFKLKNPPVLFN